MCRGKDESLPNQWVQQNVPPMAEFAVQIKKDLSRQNTGSASNLIQFCETAKMTVLPSGH